MSAWELYTAVGIGVIVVGILFYVLDSINDSKLKHNS